MLTVDYLGTLDDRHFHAVVRTALRAHGFRPSVSLTRDLAAEQRDLSRRFVEDVLSRRRPRFASEALLTHLRSVDRRLADRVPLAGALGWRQTEVIAAACARGAGPPAVDVLALGGAFNAAIATIDYIADERPHPTSVFEVLQPALVSRIFDLTADVEAELRFVFEHVDDPRLQLLLSLVATCAAEGRRLCVASGNVSTWQALGGVVLELLHAEHATAVALDHPTTSDRAALLVAAERKSVLPSVAMLRIAQLGTGATASEATIQLATTLGRVFWRIDDLADLLTDCRRGAPSTLVLQLEERLSAQNRVVVADADLYDLADEIAAEILQLIACLSPDDPDVSTARHELPKTRAFAESYVAAWVDWQDDARPPVHRRRAAMGTGEAASAALEALLVQQRAGFVEAAHTLRFPRADRSYEAHKALLSFRAVALDALLDARDAGLPVPERVLATEALRILQSKHRLLRGGWSYVPEVAELPPDADDNGQVIQVLARLGGSALAASAEEAIRLSLDAATPDGGILTWLIDPRGDTPADEAVRAYLPVMGGWGVHPEVVGNFGAGLLLLDAVRFGAPLQKIASYLEAVQNDDGSWTSKWYDGAYYGTFRVAVVLRSVRPSSVSIGRAREFVLARQRTDGGWGDGETDPLSTAFGVLLLGELGLGGDSRLARGIECLVAMQQPSGLWPAVRWIRFPTVDGEVSYGSETMTTAFGLKALVAAGVESDVAAGLMS